MSELTIQVPAEVFDLAQAGRLRLITCQYDPAADKALQEDKAKPSKVILQVRGGKRKASYEVVGTDVVLPGYRVNTRDGKETVAVIRRTTARVIIGQAMEGREPEAQSA